MLIIIITVIDSLYYPLDPNAKLLLSEFPLYIKIPNSNFSGIFFS